MAYGTPPPRATLTMSSSLTISFCLFILCCCYCVVLMCVDVVCIYYYFEFLLLLLVIIVLCIWTLIHQQQLLFSAAAPVMRCTQYNPIMMRKKNILYILLPPLPSTKSSEHLFPFLFLTLFLELQTIHVSAAVRACALLLDQHLLLVRRLQFPTVQHLWRNLHVLVKITRESRLGG